MPGKHQLWYREQSETEMEFELFQMYLRERSVNEVARQYYGERGEKAVEVGRVYISKMKKSNRWEARTKAYDRWLCKQQDNATAARIQSEIAIIKRQRISLLRKAAHKVERIFNVVTDDQLEDDKAIWKVKSLLEIAEKMDGLWRKFEEANPMQLEEAKPFQNEILSANERLLQIVEEKQRKLENKNGGEVLQ